MSRIRKIIQGAKILNLATLQAERVERYLQLLHEESYGARTLNHYAQAMNSFARWLVRNNRLTVNPLHGIAVYNAEADVRHKRRALTIDEVCALIEPARECGERIQSYDPELRARLYEVAFLTGLRRKELASLTPESFDLKSAQPTVTVAAACSKHRRTDVLSLHSQLVKVLPAWLSGMSRRSSCFPALRAKKHGSW